MRGKGKNDKVLLVLQCVRMAATAGGGAAAGRDSSDEDMQPLDLEKFAVGSLPTIFYIPDFVTPSQEQFLLHQVDGAPMSKWKVLKNRRLQNWGGVVHDKGLIPQNLPLWLTALTERIVKETRLFPASINHVLVNEYLPGQGIMPHQDGPLYFPVVAILSLGAPTLMKFMPHSKFATSIKERIYLSANSNSDTETVLPCQPPEFHDVDSFNTISRRKENFHPSTVKDITYTSVEPLSGLPSSTNLLRSKGREQCLENDTEAGLQHEHTNTVSVALMPRSLLIFKDSAYQDFLHGIDECDEHILDGKVANLSSLCHKAYSCSVQSSDPRELSSAHGLDPKDTDIGHNLLENQGKTYQRSFLKQTGTRVSLTCRYVPKSFSRFIRL